MFQSKLKSGVDLRAFKRCCCLRFTLRACDVVLSWDSDIGILKAPQWFQHVANAVVQSLSHVWLFATPRSRARHASLSFIISWSLFRLMSFELVMPFNHLILCHPLLLLPSIFPSIRVFYNVSALCIRCRKYWSFSFSISWNILMEYSNIFYWNIPMNIQGWFPLGWTGLISLQSKGLSRVFSNTTVWKHQFFGAQPSLCSNFHIHTWLLEKP